MDSGLDILDPGVPGNSPPGGVSTTTGARPPRQARYQRRYRRREGAAFWKNVRRSFEGTISRWLAVFAIIALGGGVFAGLQSVSPDMYRSADALYDGTNFMHLRVTSTMGLTDEDAQALRQVPGVRAAQPQIITEGSILDNGTAHASAILSLDLNQAGLEQPGDVDRGQINRPTVVEGRLPEAPDELLFSRGETPRDNTTRLGDVVTIGSLYGTDHPSELLRHDEFTVVGFVQSSYYLSEAVGQSPLSGSVLSRYAYLPLQAFDDPDVFTDVLLTVDGAFDQTAFSDGYAAVVDPVADSIKDIAGQREQARYAQIHDAARQKVDDGQQELDEQAADARAKIDDAQAELDTARADAERQLTDAQRTLDDGAAELADAEQQLADGQAAYDAGVQELAQQRRSVADELDTQQRTIDDGWIAYDQGQQTLADSKLALDDGKAQLDAAQVALDEARVQLDQLQLVLDAMTTRDELVAQLADLPSQRAAAVTGQQAAEAALAGLVAQRPAALAGRDEAQAGVDQLVAAGVADDDPLLVAARAGLETAQQGVAALDAGIDAAQEGVTAAGAGIAAIDAAIPQLEAGIATIDEQLAAGGVTLDQRAALQQQSLAGEAEYAAGQATVDEQLAVYEDGLRQYNDGVAQAQDAYELLVSGQQQLDDGRAQAEVEFAHAEQQLADARTQLETGRRQLADGRRELADGRRTLADKRVEAATELADGQRKIDEARATAEVEIRDAQKELDDAYETVASIERPSWYVLDRDANPGYAVFNANADRLGKITSIFPYFFFLVAALVSLTTMTRMVESERVEIGTLKALGRSQARIVSKYLLYAGSAAVLGSVSGVLIGSQLFPKVIWNAYRVIYSNVELSTPLQPGPAVWAVVVSIVATLAVTAWAAWATLTEPPAALMQPRAPAPGKRILLERLRPVWSRMSFSHKVTARNLFRYKKRMLMTVTGVAGCTGLLLTGFGVNDHLKDFVDEQYQQIFTYNTSIFFDPGKDAGAARADDDSGVARAVQGADTVRRSMFFSRHSAIAENPDGDPADIAFGVTGEAARTGGSPAAEMRASQADRRDDGPVSGILRDVTLMVPADVARLDQFVHLTDDKTREPLQLTGGQVVITPRLAENLLVGPGDTVELSRDLDDEPVTATVSAVAHMYAGHYVFLGPETYQELFGEPPEFNYVLADSQGHSVSRAEQLQASLKAGSDAVLSVVDTEYQAKTYDDINSNLVSLVAVIVVASGLLAFIVLYNLTNINIEERRREIATIKVLGFLDKEVDAYVFRETMVLSVLGGLLGLPLGWALCTWAMRSAELDNVAYGRVIHWPSHAWAFGLTLVFTLIVMVFLRFKLRGVDMVSSLKSVE